MTQGPLPGFPGIPGPGLLSRLTGSSAVNQIFLYQILGQLLGAALDPYVRALSYKSNEVNPNEVLTPEAAASAVVRGFLADGDATNEAAHSGVSADRFKTLVRLAGQALPPEELAVALRRGIIPRDSGDPDGVGFNEGIAQGNLANKWGPVVEALSTAIPSPELALDALLEGQTDEATARDLYKKFGGDLDYFQLAFDTRGGAPSPVQAGDMANRGIISWDGSGAGVVSFEQAFLEGPWRNKWLEPFKKLAIYRPPPRTVTALVRNGSITDARALELFQDFGLTAELAADYLHDAHRDKTVTAHTLARTTLEELYRDRILTRAEAVTSLVSIGYTEHDADFLLQVVDLQRQQQAISSAIARIKSLYIGYKITIETATHALTTLGIIDPEQADLIAIWNLERVAGAKELTPAQIEGALFYKVIDQDEAIALLVKLGYTPHDAWIALSVRAHGPLDNEPARGTVGIAPGIQT